MQGEECSQDKVAFLFLTIDDLNHTDIWHTLLKEVEGKYSIYIHSKKPIQDPYFKQFCISENRCHNLVYTCKTMAIALKEAFKDPCNKKFVFISDSCIPLYSLDYIIHKILSDDFSH